MTCRASRYTPNAPSGSASDHGQGLRQPDRAEEHGAHRPDERQRGRRGRRRPEPGVAPGRAEAVEHVADRRPVPEGADGGDAVREQVAGTDHHAARGTRGTRPRPEYGRRRTRSRPRCVRRRRGCAGGCRCGGGGARNAPSRAVLDTCSSRSSESCTRRSRWARRRERTQPPARARGSRTSSRWRRGPGGADR